MINLKYIKQKDRSIVVELLKKLKTHSVQTFEHSIDVANKALFIGKYLNLEQEQLEILYTAGCLHDIGKLSLSSFLLHKQGSNQQEINKIKYTHINSTYLILKDKFDRVIVNTCYHHHERLNGKGYPQGLKANKLNNYDRILQVADVVSAILQNRSYEQRLYSEDDAVKILNNLAKDNQLDGNIVNIVTNTMLNSPAQDLIKERKYKK